jgi:transposase InsO family protein
MTAPYTPQHNGLAERKNRTLVDMVNAMLLNAKLPNNLWGEALLHVTFIIEYYLKNQMFLPVKHGTIKNQI